MGVAERHGTGVDARLLVVAGAACISVSAMFIRLSGTSAGTAALFRCLLALPVLVPLTLVERARFGPRPWRGQLTAMAAGGLLGVDFVFWAHSIGDVGAGIASVLVNVQVVIVPLLAWLFLRERVSRSFAVTAPVMLCGVALAAGAVGGSGSGGLALQGAAFGLVAGTAYAGYLFGLRSGGSPRYRLQPVCQATIGAAVSSAVLGSCWGGIDLTPGWPSVGWLLALALCSQVCGWLLISSGLPRLRSNVGAALLLMQPVLAMVSGVVVLHERPTAVQLAGCCVVVAAVWLVSRGSSVRRTPRTFLTSRVCSSVSVGTARSLDRS